MAGVEAGGLYGQMLKSALSATDTVDLTDNTNNKLSLITNSATVNQARYDAADPFYSGAGTEFANKAAGVTDAAMTAQTLTLGAPATTQLKWDDTTDWAQAASTITSARAAVIYDDGVASDPLFACLDFTSDYSTTSGTFTVQFAANGIAYIDYTAAAS